MARPPTFPHSNVLVLASGSIESLLPSTLISQVESCLESHRIQEAVDLADKQRKRLQGRITVDDDESDELHYVYQRIGFQCLAETLFEDAGRHLFSGNLDPRILVSYFPEFRGSLFSATDSIDMFAGVADHMPRAASVDDIIRNYSPYMSPNTRSAPPTAELSRILGEAAVDMLEAFLHQCRTKRRVDQSTPTTTSSEINAVVDTVYAKVLARAEKTTRLYILIDEPNGIVVDEVEPFFQKYGQYNALCKMYTQRGDHERLLELWSKLVDGEWTDEDITDPLTDMFTLLSEKRDRSLTQRWGVWLTKKDVDRALKLLTARDSNKRTKAEDDLALLQQIREASPEAGAQYLEYLVLHKRSNDPQLHMELANVCLDQLFASLLEDSVSKLWRAKAASYSTSRAQASFLSYFASTTPDSEHKRVRLKTALFLQGSMFLDLPAIHARLASHQKILQLEVAVIEGKLGHHRSALSILVGGLHDEASAEAYCTLGGEIIPPKVAQSIGENYELQPWASVILLPAGSKAKSIPKPKLVAESLQKELLMVLLEVYMSSGEASSERTARLLNTQAMNLDVLEVIPLVPPEWPLNVMSSFLSRSFRRMLHARHEGQIIKSISMGQNLEVADRTWLILREQGAIVEEAMGEDDESDGVGAEGDEYHEKKPLPSLPGGSFDEKAGFHGRDDSVVDIRAGGGGEDDGLPGSVESGLR